MGHGRRPVETLPDHGINLGTDVTNVTKQQEQHRGEGEFEFFFFSGILGYLA